MDGPSRAFLPSLIAATIVACALRFADLGGIPPSLYCDEAFHGWEAYCLLETGRDSRGVALPLFFDIFGKGWGEPLYTYLTVPAVALFGLTPLAARAAAAAAGTLAVPVTGLLAAALLRGAGKGMAERAGIVAAALMAISPWSFHLSRVAFQASLLPLMLAAGFWLAARGVRAVRRKSAWLLPAGLVLGVSLYTYTVARLAMPLLLAGFVFTHRRFLRQSLRPAAAGFLALVLVSLPIAGFTLTERGRQRFSDVSLLSTGEAGGLSAAKLARRVA
ncbi:MAG TPA: glycosyltransferase family 39 protein, partial [Candidatus Polarisedimenticolia bacterium]|nr:glycosyltransferase family 39 protein [Candidatus Polarisedimenticolia bacterium]